jgi:hypothetical protein
MEKRGVSSKSTKGTRPISTKKGNSGKRPKKAAEPYVNKYPPIDFNKLKEVPEISVSVKLDQGKADKALEFKIPITMTLRKVIEKINEKHCNSCSNIRVYLVENSQKKYMDVFTYKTFKELDITPGENLNLFYEYEPIKHPLLEAGLV